MTNRTILPSVHGNLHFPPWVNCTPHVRQPVMGLSSVSSRRKCPLTEETPGGSSTVAFLCSLGLCEL